MTPAGGTGRRAPRGPGGSRPARRAPAWPSIKRKAACGPSRMATATARFSSTTGDGSHAQQQVVQAHDPGPSRSPRRSEPSACTAAMAAWRVYDPDAAGRQRLFDQGAALRRSAAGSTRSGPGLPAGSARPRSEVRAARRDSCSSIRASSPITSGSGSSSTSRRPSRMASAGKLRPCQRVARRTRSSLH